MVVKSGKHGLVLRNELLWVQAHLVMVFKDVVVEHGVFVLSCCKRSQVETESSGGNTHLLKSQPELLLHNQNWRLRQRLLHLVNLSGLGGLLWSKTHGVYYLIGIKNYNIKS